MSDGCKLVHTDKYVQGLKMFKSSIPCENRMNSNREATYRNLTSSE